MKKFPKPIIEVTSVSSGPINAPQAVQTVKPRYDDEKPDEKRLRACRDELEAVMAKHDVAGVCVIHTPGMATFTAYLVPSYSVCFLDEKQQLNIEVQGPLTAEAKKLRDDDERHSFLMLSALERGLTHAAIMFQGLPQVLEDGLRNQPIEPPATTN